MADKVSIYDENGELADALGVEQPAVVVGQVQGGIAPMHEVEEGFQVAPGHGAAPGRASARSAGCRP